MRVLVTFAVEAEFAPWRASRTFQPRVLLPDHHSGGLNVQEARVGSNTVWAKLTGIGSAGIGSRILFSMLAKEAGADVFVSSGLAGALQKEHAIGEVIAPKRIGTFRDANGIQASPELLELAKDCGAKVVGALLSSDHIIQTGAEKQRLAKFADAVDMESNDLMFGFEGLAIPRITLRAISDESDEDIPIDFTECLTESGKIRPVPLTTQIVRHPFKIPALIRFGKRSKKAAENLAVFMDSFVSSLSHATLNRDLGVAAR
jgi:adenosylhomocysteine nucleosidase